MPDTRHDDQLAEAFTRFRTEARAEIQPPGTHTVRHGARRRRTIRIASAAIVALLSAGIAIVTAMDRPDSPPLTAAQLADLSTQAQDDLREWLRPYGGSIGNFSTAVTTDTTSVTHPIGHAGSPLKYTQGQAYDLVALCRGRGTVTVAWEAPGGATGSAPAVCGGDAIRVRVTPRADGPTIQIRLEPDAKAIDRSGIAVGIIEFQ